MKRGGRVMAAWCAAVLAAAAAGAPPRVVRVTPDTGDVVDASAGSVTIEFDQDMSQAGHSLCGGGPEFPKIEGRPRWADARTFVMPVKLEPGHAYRFSVNCPAAGGFRSAAGESAEAYPVRFRTAAAGEAAPTLTPEQARAMTAALRRAVDERYSHRDTCGVDWDAAFAAARERLEGAGTPAAFARAAAELLRAANDLHATVRVNDTTLATARRATPPNADLARLATLVADWKEDGDVRWGRVAGAGVGYILIASWGSEERSLVPALRAIEALKDAPALVVDARFNSGGDEGLARRFAARFVEVPTVYSKSRIRSPEADGGWAGPFERAVLPDVGAARYAGRVAVLIGPVCMSSCESFVLMMRKPGARELFGARTFGSSGNPRPVDLGGGVTAVLPTWIDMTAEGVEIEGRGIAPDHAAAFDPRGEGDAVLEAGAAWAGGK